ncbi:TrbC/VirB2 family protein [Ahrensia marina]|nr:TrbC/VirB2 family protein [Ahrensia marina]
MGILNSVLAPCLRASFFAMLATFVVISPAAAQDLSPVTTMLTSIGTALTGPVGRALGLVALAAVGILFLTGRMNWLYAGSVVVGLVILFGAATILAGF